MKTISTLKAYLILALLALGGLTASASPLIPNVQSKPQSLLDFLLYLFYRFFHHPI